ncbi:MAG: AAA family ATPase [Planctomycetota bacterium]|jgi:predicted ATPase
MLEEFSVDNFKSLINVTFRPREQNLLLGVNNSGKTNLCQAIRFLSHTTSLKLDDCAIHAAGGPSGISNHYFAKRTIDFRVRATIPFEAEPLQYDYALTLAIGRPSHVEPALQVKAEKLLVTGSRFQGTPLIENESGDVRYLDEQKHAEGEPEYHSGRCPRFQTMLSQVYLGKSSARAKWFKDYLSSWCYYALSPEAMRGTERRLNDNVLKQDGSNLGSVVYQLKTVNERVYRLLVSHLQKLDPKIELINFAIPAEDTAYMFFEDSRGNPTPVSNASAGTLRFLALVYLLRVQPASAPTPLLMIEEPENGIYVGFLKELLNTVEGAQNGPQLIFTSHSPYFIDLFDDRLDGVFVLKGGEEHSAITQPDPAQVKARLEKYPLGEQHFREMLG